MGEGTALVPLGRPDIIPAPAPGALRAKRRGPGRPPSFLVTTDRAYRVAWRKEYEWAQEIPEYIGLYRHLQEAARDGYTTRQAIMDAIRTRSWRRIERLLTDMDEKLGWIVYRPKNGMRYITVNTLTDFDEYQTFGLQVTPGYTLQEWWGYDLDRLCDAWVRLNCEIRGMNVVIPPAGRRTLRLLMRSVGDEGHSVFLMRCYLAEKVDFPDGASYQMNVWQWKLQREYPWRLQTFCNIADLVALQVEAAAATWVAESGQQVPHGYYFAPRELMYRRQVQRMAKKQGRPIPPAAALAVRRSFGLPTEGDTYRPRRRRRLRRAAEAAEEPEVRSEPRQPRPKPTSSAQDDRSARDILVEGIDEALKNA